MVVSTAVCRGASVVSVCSASSSLFLVCFLRDLGDVLEHVREKSVRFTKEHGVNPPIIGFGVVRSCNAPEVGKSQKCSIIYRILHNHRKRIVIIYKDPWLLLLGRAVGVRGFRLRVGEGSTLAQDRRPLNTQPFAPNPYSSPKRTIHPSDKP